MGSRICNAHRCSDTALLRLLQDSLMLTFCHSMVKLGDGVALRWHCDWPGAYSCLTMSFLSYDSCICDDLRGGCPPGVTCSDTAHRDVGYRLPPSQREDSNISDRWSSLCSAWIGWML